MVVVAVAETAGQAKVTKSKRSLIYLPRSLLSRREYNLVDLLSASGSNNIFYFFFQSPLISVKLVWFYRYERGGKPLMSRSDDDVYSLLFLSTRSNNVSSYSLPPGSQSTVTRSVHAHTSAPPLSSQQHHYAPERGVPICGSCGAARTFEFQLMPNLVGELERASLTGGDEEEKDNEGGGDEEVEFGWTTALVFVCSNDCLPEGSDRGWREEVVLVQLDD
jgi:hypothetical protein